jgi:hypothetical protein
MATAAELQYLATVDGESAFFRALCEAQARPVGMHRHFRMLVVQRELYNLTERTVSIDALWKKFSTCYDIELLEGNVRLVPLTQIGSARLTFCSQESEAGTEGSSIGEVEYRLPEALQEGLKLRLELDGAVESPVAESTVTSIRRSTATKKGNKTGIESNDSDSSLSEDQAEPSVVETEDEPGQLLRVTGACRLSNSFGSSCKE